MAPLSLDIHDLKPTSSSCGTISTYYSSHRSEEIRYTTITMTASPRERIKISHAIRLLIGLTFVVMFFNSQNKPCNYTFNDESSPKPDAEKEPDASQERPFPMPIHGEKFEIFQPLYDMDESKKNPQLLLSPKEFLGTFEERISWAKSKYGASK